MEDEFFTAIQADNSTKALEFISIDPKLLAVAGPGGWPAIHLAAYFGALNCLKGLLAAGANIELRSQNDNANTPLHAAVAGGQAESIKILVENGADIHATYFKGTHVLHEASFLGRQDLVKLLLELGANPNAKNDSGEFPVDLARKQGHAEIVELLEQQ